VSATTVIYNFPQHQQDQTATATAIKTLFIRITSDQAFTIAKQVCPRQQVTHVNTETSFHPQNTQHK